LSQKNLNSSGINKNWKPAKESPSKESVDYYVQGIKNNDRTILSEAITLIESKKKNADFILNLLEGIYIPEPNTLRIGISGSPGAGKSTFINALGSFLSMQGKKVAVLAVDPSSEINKGSILGDKTRMYKLIQNPNVYVRPTPSNSYLGGVASTTKESIQLCEAAGYEIILIETVGVGQSETLVKNMVDLFCLILLPGAGDDLQGIKKGIVEMSDLFIINKADKGREQLAKESKNFYRNAIKLNAQSKNKDVLTCSSLEEKGIEKIWESTISIVTTRKENQSFYKIRETQDKEWIAQKKEAIALQHFKTMFSDEKEETELNPHRMYKTLMTFNKEMELKIDQLKGQINS